MEPLKRGVGEFGVLGVNREFLEFGKCCGEEGKAPHMGPYLPIEI